MKLDEIIKKLNLLNDYVIELVAKKESLEKENEFLKELLLKKQDNPPARTTTNETSYEPRP